MSKGRLHSALQVRRGKGCALTRRRRGLWRRHRLALLGLRLEEGGYDPIFRVYAHNLRRIALARLKVVAIVRSRRHVELAAKLIVNVLAVVIGRAAVLANAKAVGGGVHKAVPFVCLNKLVPESIRENKAANRIAKTVLAMRIQLTATTFSVNKHSRKVGRATDLHVVRRLDKMNTLERAWRDKTGTTTRLGAITHNLALGSSHAFHFRAWGAPQTKVCGRVDVQVLAVGVGIRAFSTRVGTSLTFLRDLGKMRSRYIGS